MFSLNLKKMAAGLLAGCLTFSLAACGGAGGASTSAGSQSAGTGSQLNQQQDGGTGAMGRYVETTVTDATEKIDHIMGLKRDDAGTVTFYSVTWQDGADQIVRHEIQSDDSITSVTTTWGSSLSAQGAELQDIAELADGTVYLLTTQSDSAAIFESTLDQAECTPLNITDWPESSFAMSEGALKPIGIDPGLDSLLVTYDDRVEVRDKTGAKLHSFDGFVYLKSYDVSSADGVLMIRDNPTDMFLRYDLNTYEQIGENQVDATFMDATSQVSAEALYFADDTGIYSQNVGGDKWEQVVSGDGTSMGAPANTISALTCDGTGGYYVAFSTPGGAKLVHYTYSSTTPAVPEQELTIYSLTDYPILRQAISEFQAQNPDVRVTLQVPAADGATTEDTIRALNTEILNGKGPDLLVLDGLPAQSYVEKGVLTDLSDFASQQTDLLENLVNSQKQESGLFEIPAQFTVPVMLTASQEPQPDSLDALMQKIQSNGDTKPYLYVPDNLEAQSGSFLMDWYHWCAPEVLSGNTLDTAELGALFGQIQQLHDLLAADKAKFSIQNQGSLVEGDGITEVIDLGISAVGQGNASAHVSNFTGQSSLRGLSALKNGQFQLQSLFGAGRFIPRCSMGILESSQQKELAQQFLQVLFGQSVQTAYVGVGFPVNAAALETVTRANLEDESGELASIGSQFLELCQNLNTPVAQDAMIENAISSRAYEIMTGTLSPETAAQGVSEDVKLYLAE